MRSGPPSDSSHTRGIGVVTQDEDAYPVTTDYENGVQLVQSFGDVVQSPVEGGES